MEKTKKEIRIAVIGSRGFFNYKFFCEKLEHLISNLEGEIEFVSGGCKTGGDVLIKRYCQENNFKLVEHLPDWDLYGKKAGFLRNQLIVDDCTHLIAYWDNVSKGTLSSIKMAQKKGIPIKIVTI